MGKSEQTRQVIIEKSALLFNKKGYASTSLSDLEKNSGFSKGAIYDNFPTKNELAVAAFEYSSTISHSHIKAAMEAQPSAGSALLAFADFYPKNWEKLFERGGCHMMNAAVEADDHLNFLIDGVRESMKQAMMLLQVTIERGQRNGEFSQLISAEKYASVIFLTIEGGILLAKAMNDPGYLQVVKERVYQIVKQELIK